MEKLLCALRKTGKDWDFEKMELVNIKEKFVPKPGDVCNSGDGAIYIFKADEDGSRSRFYAAYFKKEIFIDRTVTAISRRLATREERCVFFEELTKEGYKWDAKKLKLTKKLVPKEGDFLVDNGGNICIYHSTAESGGIVSFAGFGGHLTTKTDKGWGYTMDFKPANDSEKKILLDAMHASGKDWDAKNKKVVDYKWKPEIGECFFVPSLMSLNFYTCYSWDNDSLDNTKFGRGLVFKTKEEAISRAKQMLEK